MEIIFGADGVFVGDRYFGLVNTGMLKFEGVQMLPSNPLALEFGTVATTISHVSTSLASIVTAAYCAFP